MGSVQRRALVTAMGGIKWLLRDDFDAGAATLPRVCIPGPGTLTGADSGSKLSVTGGKLSGVGTTAVNDPRILAGPYAGVAGRVFLTEVTYGGNSQRWSVGWAKSANNSPGDAFYVATSLRINPLDNSSQLINDSNVTLVAGTSYRMAFLLLSARTLMLIRGGEFTDWTLLWSAVNNPMHATANYAGAGSIASSTDTRTHDFMRIRDTSLGDNLESINLASPASDTLYTGTADAMIDVTFTAPNPLANTAELRFRVLDDQNYWTAYFNASGQFRIDTVSAGVATNRLNINSAIAAGETRSIRVSAIGGSVSQFTKLGVNWTRHLAPIAVSHQDTQTGVKVIIGANWTAANLVSVPTLSPIYNVFDQGLPA
jgi:hypothetical protein